MFSKEKKIICIEIKYSKYDKEYKIKYLFLFFFFLMNRSFYLYNFDVHPEYNESITLEKYYIL